MCFLWGLYILSIPGPRFRHIGQRWDCIGSCPALPHWPTIGVSPWQGPAGCSQAVTNSPVSLSPLVVPIPENISIWGKLGMIKGDMDFFVEEREIGGCGIGRMYIPLWGSGVTGLCVLPYLFLCSFVLCHLWCIFLPCSSFTMCFVVVYFCYTPACTVFLPFCNYHNDMQICYFVMWVEHCIIFF